MKAEMVSLDSRVHVCMMIRWQLGPIQARPHLHLFMHRASTWNRPPTRQRRISNKENIYNYHYSITIYLVAGGRRCVNLERERESLFVHLITGCIVSILVTARICDGVDLATSQWAVLQMNCTLYNTTRTSDATRILLPYAARLECVGSLSW